MTPSSDLRVLFRVAAGPRRGFGHLVRSISLARAMGAPVYLQERLGPEPQSWVRAFDLVVSADARGIAIAQAGQFPKLSRPQ